MMDLELIKKLLESELVKIDWTSRSEDVVKRFAYNKGIEDCISIINKLSSGDISDEFINHVREK
jgi:hypothetical protein